MSRRRDVILAWVLGLALVALHLDFWRASEARLLVGLVPEELAYRLGWMAAASVYLVWFTTRVWRAPEELE